MDRRSHITMHCFFHRFSRKFDILKRVRTVDVHGNIIYKRKVQKVNLINVEITDESRSRINFKWKKFLKSSITSKFVEQLSDVYNSFLTFKFSKIKQNFKLTSERLQKIFFDAELSLQERELMMKLLYWRKVVLV